jgi:imidazolonepropionase-like amidohydrolase
MYLIKHMIADVGNVLKATEMQRDPIRDDYDNMREMLPRANEAGLKICIGDDYGIIVLPHARGAYNRELEYYVKEVGIGALDVIRWATRNPGELMTRGTGLPLGLVREGYMADLLVVDGDPSQDISILCDLSHIRAIVKGGDFVKDELAA